MVKQLNGARNGLLAILLAGGWQGHAHAGWVEELCADHRTPAMCIATIKWELDVLGRQLDPLGNANVPGSGWNFRRLPGTPTQPQGYPCKYEPPRSGWRPDASSPPGAPPAKGAVAPIK